jgi:chorismate-pyruvate lyase
MTTLAAASELLHPLTHFRRNGGGGLPSYEIIEAGAVPEPYRRLLVHDGDMTSRLEAFHRGAMVLDVLHREQTKDAYRREVLLRVEETGLPVEYGAIEIHLSAFAGPLRERIVEAHTPLGGLLNQFGVRYRSRPRAFLQFAPDAEMDALFDIAGAHPLYGRANVLLDESEQTLAQIVEVLRP